MSSSLVSSKVLPMAAFSSKALSTCTTSMLILLTRRVRLASFGSKTKGFFVVGAWVWVTGWVTGWVVGGVVGWVEAGCVAVWSTCLVVGAGVPWVIGPWVGAVWGSVGWVAVGWAVTWGVAVTLWTAVGPCVATVALWTGSFVFAVVCENAKWASRKKF